MLARPLDVSRFGDYFAWNYREVTTVFALSDSLVIAGT